MTTGFFPLCGDVLHAGHVLALQEARRRCDRLIVGLNTHPEGKRPVQSVYERWAQVSALACVDEVIPYQGRRDAERLAASLDYDIRFLGEDHRGRDWDGKEQERERKITPCFLSRRHGLSSTELKERIYEDCRLRHRER